MRRVVVIGSVAALLLTVACLADPTLPDDVGDRTPCSTTDECPAGYTCPTVEGAGVARCVPSTRAACGNAVLDDFEQCDDGNWIDGDGCRADCTTERCGDGRVDAGEGCDDGGASATCSAQCTKVVCGDLIVQTPELCDDGNTVGGDGCSSDCLSLEYCGNDLLDPGEACDDANHVSGDGCRADCSKVEVCGDRIVDDGEACDDGNSNPSDGCHACARPTWTARVVTGLGESGGDPLAVPMLFPSAAYDRRGQVVVSDGVTHLFRVDAYLPNGPEGDRVAPLVGAGTHGYGGDGSPATGAHIDSPNGFDIDDAGRIFVADTGNARVRMVDTDGVIQTLAGTGVPGPVDDGSLAALAPIGVPRDVALDREGNLYVAEETACAIHQITGAADPLTATITLAAGGSCADTEPVRPRGLVVNDAGDLFIADAARSVVWKLPVGAGGAGTASLVIVAGRLDDAGPATPGPATSVRLDLPADVAVDGARLYIADRNNNQVHEVVDGLLSHFAGTGSRGFDGDGGPAVNAVLSGPQRVTARDGRVLIGDTRNRRVREVDVDGTIHTVAGAMPTPRPQHAFGSPIAVDDAGDVYLFDINQLALWKIASGGAVTLVAGNGISGYDGEGLPAAMSRVNPINGLAFDATGAILLAEPASNRIRRIAADGTLTTIAGNGDVGPAADGALALTSAIGPVSSVAVDPTTGLVWFCTSTDYTIRRIDADGTLATPVGTGVAGFAGDGGSGSLARIGFPTDLAFTDDGVLVFADATNRRVRSFDPVLDVVDTVAGTGASGFAGDGGDARLANLDDPRHVAVAADGAILIADWLQHRVRRVATDGVITTVMGDGTASLAGDGGPSAAAHVVAPVGLAVDRSAGAAVGDVVLSDVDDDRGVLRRVRGGVIDSVNPRFDDGVGSLDHGALAAPSAFVSLAPVASDLALFAGGDTGFLERVRFDPGVAGGGAIDVVAGRPNGFVLGAASAAGGDPSPVSGEARARYLDRFGDACGLAFDGVDALYLADRGNGVIARVRLVDPNDPSTWTVALVAGAPGDRRHVDGAAGAARLVGPCGLALDTASNALFVADADDATVRRVDLDDGAVITLFGVAGLAGADDDLLDGPMALALDVEGALVVADTGNHRVRRLSVAGDIVVDAAELLGTGEPASAGDGAPARAFPVEAPRGLSFDAHGNLLVTSTRAVRLVTAADTGVVDGSGAVLTIYGAAPRDAFPQDSTYCLSGVDAPADGVVRVIDACQGFLVELTRAP